MKYVNFKKIISESTKKLLKPKSSKFWRNAFGVMLVGLVLDMTLLFLFPLYFKKVLNFSYFDVGLVIAFITFISSVFMFLSVKKNIPLDFLSSLTFVTLAPSLILLPIYASTNFLIWIFIFSIGYASASVMMEAIISDAVSGAKSDELSSDLGVLYIPIRLSEFVFAFGAGYLISYLGYFSVFLVFSAIIFIFLFYAKNILNVHLLDFSYVSGEFHRSGLNH